MDRFAWRTANEWASKSELSRCVNCQCILKGNEEYADTCDSCTKLYEKTLEDEV